MNDREEQQREDGADELLDQGMAKAFADHDDTKAALGDDSCAAFRDDATDSLPEAERDAWRTLWQKMRALIEDQ